MKNIHHFTVLPLLRTSLLAGNVVDQDTTQHVVAASLDTQPKN